MTERLTHLDEGGRARMVDVSAKPETVRVARASAWVRMQPATVSLIRDGAIPKGDVPAVARIAGIMAAKQTALLVPMCHPLPLTGVEVEVCVEDGGVEIRTGVRTVSRTGVEMEALVAASAAALAVYDMCKAVDKSMVIEGIRILEKRGGKSDWRASVTPETAAAE